MKWLLKVFGLLGVPCVSEHGITDSDWASDLDDRKSTADYVFSLGFGPITLACKKQQALALSSAEAEY